MACLSYSGVRVSGFLNEDKKRYQQKSIVHFLEPGKQDSGSRLLSRTSDEEIFPKTPERESFFNKKRATREQANKETSVNESSSKHSPQDIKSATSIEQAKDNDHQIFICPVCFKEHQDSNLDAFNRHIDSCLSETVGKDNAEITNGSKLWENKTDLSLESQKNKCQKDKTSEPRVEIQPTDKIDNSFSSSIDGFPQLKDNEYSSQSRYSCPDDFICSMPAKQDASSKLLPVEKEDHCEPSSCTEIKLPCFPSITETKSLVCPVCNLEQNTKDLALFNKHVDVCLNKGIIKELTECSKSMGEFYHIEVLLKVCFEHLRSSMASKLSGGRVICFVFCEEKSVILISKKAALPK